MAIPTPLRRSPSQDADQEQFLLPSVLGSRKTHKTLNNGGLVWPPELEKVLLDALYKYRPPNNPDRDTRLLKRHPMRNKFIADYIKNETGVVRSPKQVGSRLQQMRDTCEDKRVADLVSRKAYGEPTPETLSPLAPTSLTASSSGINPYPPLAGPAISRGEGSLQSDTRVAVTRVLQTEVRVRLSPSQPDAFSSNIHEETMSDATIMALPPTIHVQTDSPSVSVHLSPSIHSSSCPITMLCSSELRPSEVRYRSQFYVYMNDSLIASEKTTLELLSTSTSLQNPKESEMEETSAGMVNVWGTRFIPEYWEDFKKSFPDDLSQCKVVQAVYDNDTILCHRMVYLFELTHNETHSNTSSVGRPHLDAPARVMSLPPPAIPPEPDDIDLQYPNEEQLDAYSGSSSPSQSAEYAFSPITTTVNPTTASSMSASVCNCPGCATSMQNNVIVQAPGVPSTSPNVSQNPFSYTYFWGNNPIPQLDVSRISQNESIPTTMSIRSNSYSDNTRSRDVMLALSTDMNAVDGSDPYSYFERNGRTETSSWDFSLKDEDQKLFKSSPTEMEIDQPWLHEPMPFSLPQLPPVASLLANARTTDINDAPMQEYIAGSPSRHGDGFGQLC